METTRNKKSEGGMAAVCELPPPPQFIGKAFFVCLCLCLVAGLAAGCSAEGAEVEDEPVGRSYSITQTVAGPGALTGLPESAVGGDTVTFIADKTRGDAESVSAVLTASGEEPSALNADANGNFVFVMPKKNVMVAVTFSVVFPYNDTAISAGETLFIKTAANETFLLSKNNDDWTDAPQGYLASDVVAFDALSGDRVVIVTTEPDLDPVSPVHLTFTGANLTPSRATDGSPLAIKDGAKALVTMEGSNSFLPGANGSAGILVATGSNLTLTGPQGATLTATGKASGSGSASAGIGGSSNGGYGKGGDITITGQIKVTANGGYNGPGIGAGFGDYGGTLMIGGNAEVKAQGGHGAAGLGGGYGGDGGTIIIQENAEVLAIGNNERNGAAGIGGGGCGGAGGIIIIKENATVIGKGGGYRSGIGGDWSDGESTQITILGNARVYGQAAATDAAGIGAGDGDGNYVSGAKITIGDGTDNPLVIARGSPNTDSNPHAACGLGGGGASKASKVYIEIKSGTVIAQSNRTGGAAIGAQNPSADSYVKISGGAVYTLTPDAAPTLARPAAVGANGSTLVYPLYAPIGTSGPVSVPLSGAAYEAPVFDSRLADFLTFCNIDAGTVFPGLSALASELWVPEGSYTGITAGSAVKSAEVNAEYPAYSAGMTENVLQ